MRSIKLVPALAAMAALLTLAPAGALAAPKRAGKPKALKQHGLASPKGGCRLKIIVLTPTIEAGEAASLSGRLSCTPAASEAHQTVTLVQRAVGAAAPNSVQSAVTEANGSYQFTTSPLNMNTFVYASLGSLRSGRREIGVAARVTLKASKEGPQLYTGRRNTVIFSGTVSPADASAIVSLQREASVSANEWQRIGLGSVGPHGEYSIPHTFSVPGDANIRVLVHSEHRNIPSPSNELSFFINQTENPQLTILSAADPIFWGQSVTIQGKLAGVTVSTPVTLLAHTRGDAFAAVAEAMSNPSGEYTFPTQSPTSSTFYQVKGAGKSSAVLYEGVKYLLTAEVSQTTVTAGQPLTFKGAVSPGHEGHLIYLEAQNPFGARAGTFHVIQVATVGKESSYSFLHTIYNAGTKVFRVKIPGDPGNAGAASTPFTITVNPATAGSLVSPAPGNSSMPPEGQI
ncbi:MAG: hypothetical protein ABSG95_11320 [Solirubrobacteraceae bacterium]|jgi:hypothetical protein